MLPERRWIAMELEQDRLFPGDADPGFIATSGGTGRVPAGSSLPGTTRAAQYVRMSTEHQQYSTENQADAIRQYAERRAETSASDAAAE